MRSEQLKNLRAIAFDCDGVLTDARIVYSGNGQWSRFYSIRDGLGMRKLMDSGVLVAIITTSQSEDIRKRAEALKIHDFYEGYHNKLEAWEDFKKKHQLSDHEIAFMGDDDMDIPVLKKAGFAATVADAMEDVLQVAHYVAKRPAGNGAVREVCELILTAKK